MSRTRICIVAPEFIGPYPNGGVGTACYWEAHTLGLAGHDVTVLYTGRTERETPAHWEMHFAAAAPFRYVDLGRWAENHALTHPPREGYACVDSETSDTVLAWLATRHFDLVLFQEFLGHGARALQARHAAAAFDGVRMATTLHSSRQWVYEGMKRLPASPADSAVDYLEKASARLADAVICPSRHMSEWAASRWRLAAPGDVIPYCFDATLAGMPAVVEHPGPFRHLVFFGRLETRKGLHLFCEALATPALRGQIDRVTFLGKPSSVEGQPSDAYIAARMAGLPAIDWRIIGDAGSFEAQTWLASQSQALVVAPSLVDNLPYAVIELYTRRLPFVSTAIGGIPEIVGAANGHLLAEPTVASLGATIARACRDGRLSIDYRSGYDVRAANEAHVAFVHRLLAQPAPPRAEASSTFDVVVTNAADDAALQDVRTRVVRHDAAAAAARWTRVADWAGADSTTPAIVLDARVEPSLGALSRLLVAIAQPDVSIATGYFLRATANGDDVRVAPLGASLETGWRDNVFGGPCFAAHPRAFPAIASAITHGMLPFWPAYAAAACSGLTEAVLPEVLFRVPEAALEARYDDVEGVIRQYHARRPDTLDLGWTLKSARAGGGSGAHADLAMLSQFFSMPDDLLAVYAGLASPEGRDPYVHDLVRVRERLHALVTRWQQTEPRVFVYGTGTHTRRLLSICPELGRFLGGFIDRQAAGSFLGLPCVTPDDFRAELADVVVYSSREFEHEMYARLRHLPVEHVLLYRDTPPSPEPSTATRLTNRFGAAPVPLAGLQAMYHPPSWATGYVSGEDAAFLVHMVSALQPSTVVELGVASGASSAALLFALDQLPEAPSRALYSCDVRATCYFNEAYETGQACREMYPTPRAAWHRAFSTDARRLAAQLPPGGADLTFIDANHSHPWPLLDLLHVTAFARPGSWIILHDVDLPVQHPEHQVFGPRWLFQAWPFNKVKGVGRWTSIAAVQLPADLARLTPLALALLERRWEQAPTPDHAALPAPFQAVRAAIEARLGVAAPALVRA